MTARPQGFYNSGVNGLLIDSSPEMRNQSDSGGGTMADLGSLFNTSPANVPVRGKGDAHIPVAVLVVVAIAYLIGSRRLGLTGIHVRV